LKANVTLQEEIIALPSLAIRYSATTKPCYSCKQFGDKKYTLQNINMARLIHIPAVAQYTSGLLLSS